MDMSSGCVRSVFIFTDLPRHIEFRAGNLPRLERGLEIEFDLTLKNPHDSQKSRHIEGFYRAKRVVMKYSTGKPSISGLTQYIEWEPVQ